MPADNEKGAAPRNGGSEAARLRDDIDRGATGEKIAFSDPAAVPLGTDAEAGGTPTDPAAMAGAREAEIAAQDSSEPKKTPAELQRTRGPGIIAMIAIGAALALSLFLLLAAW
ncbi:hypothetical protein [Salipiger sp.]|uniref:hypothetical protein n=1 Tax=Salipiger sp. TaxID=2078585 RepID=UPI003A96AC81